VLHYAQEIFEGMKAYRHDDGSVWTFRPEANAERMVRSSRRLALPELPVDDFVQAVDALVEADQRWVPDAAGEKSLYIRPFMIATEAFLGVRPAQHVTFMVIASPAGAYFSKGIKPISLWLSTEYTRAGRGGMGAAKTGGNYASSLIAQQEATGHGCDQVVFLDAQEGQYVEELGGMNMYFVYADGHIVTPEVGTILEGITRSSIIELAGKLGHQVEERRFSVDEWRDGVASGDIVEVFACGTAAVVTPVGQLKWDGGEVGAADGEAGELTMRIRQALVDIQYGRADDTFGWMHQVT
jgi:branched-chain amino acid aminotransferase